MYIYIYIYIYICVALSLYINIYIYIYIYIYISVRGCQLHGPPPVGAAPPRAASGCSTTPILEGIEGGLLKVFYFVTFKSLSSHLKVDLFLGSPFSDPPSGDREKMSKSPVLVRSRSLPRLLPGMYSV